MDRSYRQKIRKHTGFNTLDHVDTQRTFYPKTEDTFTWTSDILWDRSHARPQKTSNLKGLKYQKFLLNTLVENWKKQNSWRQSNMLQINQWVDEEIRENVSKVLGNKSKWKNMVPKLMGCRKSSSKRKAYSNTDLPHEKKKNSYTQSNFISKTPRKQKKPLVEGRNQYRSEHKWRL